MEHPNDFHKLLRQILSQEPRSLMCKEDIEQAVFEMDVFELVGDRHVVWMN
jgi:hypothetical protein